MRLGVNGWRCVDKRTGVARVILNIIKHWDRETVGGTFDEVNFYTPSAIDGDVIELPNGMREVVLPSKLPMLVWDSTRLNRAADEDVLWCPSYSVPIGSRAKSLVVSIYEATLKLYPQYFPKSKWYSFSPAYLQLYKWSAHKAKLVHTSTEAGKADICRAYDVPPEKVRVVPLAPAEFFVDLGDDDRIPTIRETYLGTDAPYFLYVGKMTPRRNVPKLMEAFAELKRRHTLPHKLIVVGLNSTNVDIESWAKELGITDDFKHAEYVSDEDLILLYNGAYAFVLPYTYESISLTTLEAQATGCPVITTDTPGLVEITGGHALYLKQAEVPDILESLERMATDAALRDDLSKRGLEFAADFTWERTARETLDVLAEAADR